MALAPSEKEELKNRVLAKKYEMEAKLRELEAQGQQASRDQAETLKARLKELNEEVSDGWDQLSEKAAGKLNDWLSKAA